jgi:myo-inositol-hexaphosphate 3-phosphohydrolase
VNPWLHVSVAVIYLRFLNGDMRMEFQIGFVGLIISAMLIVACIRDGAARNVNVTPVQNVVAAVETEPVNTKGDSADDATLWVHASDPSLSLVIGTNKKSGLAVYDLSGKEIQFVQDGQMNNVDHRDGFSLAGKNLSLVTASNRSNNTIGIYKIDADTRRLENVAVAPMKTIDAYGSCMYKSKAGKFYYIVTSKQGMVEQYELFEEGKGVSAKRVRQFKVGTQLEGCVADDELGDLYIGEEHVGIWKYPAEPDAELLKTRVDTVGPGSHLVADVEGLTIAYESDGKGYLIASSQVTVHSRFTAVKAPTITLSHSELSAAKRLTRLRRLTVFMSRLPLLDRSFRKVSLSPRMV